MPRMASFVRLPLGLQQLSVCNDDIRGGFCCLDTIRSTFVLKLATFVFIRSYFDLRFGLELGVFLVAECAERCRRRIRMDAVVGGAIAGTIALSREETFAGLARAVAHLRLCLVIHLKNVH